MTPRDFVYWLNGLMELSPGTQFINEEQTKMIRQHLKYVFDDMNKPVVTVAPPPMEGAGGTLQGQGIQWPQPSIHPGYFGPGFGPGYGGGAVIC